MDVAGDPFPFLLQFPLTREPAAIPLAYQPQHHRGHHRRRRGTSRGDEARALPEQGFDVECGRRPLRGVLPVEAGPHFERVAAGGQAAKHDAPRTAHRRPVVIRVVGLHAIVPGGDAISKPQGLRGRHVDRGEPHRHRRIAGRHDHPRWRAFDDGAVPLRRLDFLNDRMRGGAPNDARPAVENEQSLRGRKEKLIRAVERVDAAGAGDVCERTVGVEPAEQPASRWRPLDGRKVSGKQAVPRAYPEQSGGRILDLGDGRLGQSVVHIEHRHRLGESHQPPVAARPERALTIAVERPHGALRQSRRIEPAQCVAVGINLRDPVALPADPERAVGVGDDRLDQPHGGVRLGGGSGSCCGIEKEQPLAAADPEPCPWVTGQRGDDRQSPPPGGSRNAFERAIQPPVPEPGTVGSEPDFAITVGKDRLES